MDRKELAKKRNKEIEEALKAASTYGSMTMNEIRESLQIGTIPYRDDCYSTPRITNCKNCAAPINKDGYCEYCGTWYR